jgi:hypothetical protein
MAKNNTCLQGRFAQWVENSMSSSWEAVLWITTIVEYESSGTSADVIKA